MTKEWKSSPPVHLMLASYFGLKPGDKKQEEGEDLGGLVRNLPRDPMVLPTGNPMIGRMNLENTGGQLSQG